EQATVCRHPNHRQLRLAHGCSDSQSLKDDCRPRRRRRSGTETSFRSGPIPDAGSQSVGVVVNRREFFLALLLQSRSASVEVAVMEVFSASDGPAALLVHHADKSARNTFGQWLRQHDGERVTWQLNDGTDADG